MKHYFLRMLMLFVGISCLVALPGCSSDDEKDAPEVPKTLAEQLVGQWIETKLEDDEPPFLMILNANQTGSISFSVSSRAAITFTQNFKWSANTDSNGQGYFSILTTSGDELLNDGQFTCILIGDELYLGGLRFKRK